jgi:hypothetical protein
VHLFPLSDCVAGDRNRLKIGTDNDFLVSTEEPAYLCSRIPKVEYPAIRFYGRSSSNTPEEPEASISTPLPITLCNAKG